MTDKPEIVVIADLPSDLRNALSEDFNLLDAPLEGPNAIAPSALPSHPRAIATRAVLGVPAAVLDALPRLGLVISMGAGLDHIDVEALKTRNIALAFTPDQFTEDVADYALGLIYAAQRKIVEADRFVRSGAWATTRFATSRRVSTRHVGIVGLGRIGQSVARKCAALGMSISYHARAEHPGCTYPFHTTVHSLAAACDILVLACAVTPETRGLVDRDVLAALGSDGILINIARGAVVDETALIEALENKTLGGAALDVFAREPHLDKRFLALNNVILTPHAASFTFEARQAVIDHLVSSARAFFAQSAAARAPAES